MKTTVKTIKYNSRTSNYVWLSNFYVEPDTTHVEGEYQANKHSDPAKIQAAITLFMALDPVDTQRLGKRIQLRRDWDQVKDLIMYELILQKFKDHPELRAKLLDTGNATLIHDCWWGDTYWGMCRDSGGLMYGKNKHGEITMRVREELRGIG